MSPVGNDPREPARMSFTRTVPAEVPSDCQSSRPETGATNAVKYSVPPDHTKEFGVLLEPGAMSFTRTVPAAVRSVFHSSVPCSSSYPQK